MSQVTCWNFKMSCVGVLSRLHNAVGNLATYICLRQSFVAFSFERCRHFLAHVACRNLPWHGLMVYLGISFCCCYVQSLLQIKGNLKRVNSGTKRNKIVMIEADYKINNKLQKFRLNFSRLPSVTSINHNTMVRTQPWSIHPYITSH